ncbi:endoglucanase, partial [Streptomyces sp. SID7982]|nr:endoglucanase [Streptomyces sp. SID7982]
AVSQTGGGAEMLLWLKTPGESDGDCGVGAGSVAGQFLPEVAYKMIHGY